MSLLLLLGVAAAGTAVIYDQGDPTTLVAEVAQRTGLPVSQLEPRSLDQLLKAAPSALGDAVIRRCAGAPTQGSAVETELARAQAAFATGNLIATQDHLDLAVADLGCLGELVNPTVGASIFLLRGALEIGLGQTDAARSELRSALAFNRAATWPASWAPEGVELLAEEQAALAAARILVLPTSTTAGPWVDGRQIEAEGRPIGLGLHLAQHPTPAGVRSAWLVVAGESTLVIPGAYRRPILDAMADPFTTWPVAALVQVGLPGQEAAYVTFKGGLWLLAWPGGELSRTELAPIPPPPPVEEPTKRGKKGKHKP